jgi:hypothetical protein
MGLRQVRDLRRSAARAIIEGRSAKAYQSVRDLLSRVALQPKEVSHLIRCGALDGLGDSRIALLADVGEIDRGGSTQQMALPLSFETLIEAEDSAQRLSWERQILGLPVSVQPLETVDQLPPHHALHSLAPATGPVTTVAYRLPGYTGGTGFFISDGQTLLVARAPAGLRQPEVWRPVRLTGQLRQDSFGTSWFQVGELTPL